MNWATGGGARFDQGGWSQPTSKVYVFDNDYVQDNLHVAGNVTRDNKRRLVPIVLGDEGVRLSNQIAQFDQEQKDLDISEKAAANEIRASLWNLDEREVQSWISTTVPIDIADKIISAKKGLELADQALQVKRTRMLRYFDLGGMSHYFALLKLTLENVAEGAAVRVDSHFKKHHLSTDGQSWVRAGLPLVSGKDCPFCDQPIGDSQLLLAYRTLFSDEYDNLIGQIQRAKQLIESLVDRKGAEEEVAQNVELCEFWATICDLGTIATENEIDLAKVVAGLQALKELLEKKLANPLSVVEVGAEELLISQAFAELSAYDQRVKTANGSIEKAKMAAAHSDSQSAELELLHLRRLEAKLSDPLKSTAETYTKIGKRKGEVETQKKKLQAELRDFAKKTVGSWQHEINGLLSDFGANFSIVNTSANFKGREANTEFAISLGSGTVLAGEGQDDKPSFKTVLSSGDKMTLALAFFLVQVNSDAKLAERLVVFDDPFNSQDLQRQFETACRIRKLVAKCSQVLVFSHDPRFLHMIEKDANSSVTGTFQVTCSDEGVGVISTWSSVDELKDVYVRQSEWIREFAKHGTLLKDVNELALIQALRPFLECFIHARYPGRFPEKTFLSEMAESIKTSGSSDPLFEAVEDFVAINEYTRANHHASGKHPDKAELRAQCKKIHRILGSF